MMKLLIGPLAELASKWMSKKAEKAQAKHEREIAVIRGEIDADIESASDMRHSYKDEYLVILLTLPVIIVFYAAIAGDANMIGQIKGAFAVMTELPEWYTWALLGAVASSFGIRTFEKFGGK